MTQEEFEDAVARSFELIPQEFKDLMENVSIVVQDYPDQHQMEAAGLGKDQMLLGLYQGVPLTQRRWSVSITPLDKITIFKEPIEARCRSLGIDISKEIARVVKHEIGHHFGIDDKRLNELGY